MAIKINEIPPEGLTLEFAAQKLDLFEEGAASAEFTAAFSIKPSGGGTFRISGWVKAAPVLQCNRCLESFPYPVDAKMSFDLAPASSLGAEQEHELGRSELDMDFYQGEEIEPLDFIREQMLLSIPMVPVHSQDCKGLCPVCGKNLNIEDCGHRRDLKEEAGAFSVLKDIFKK